VTPDILTTAKGLTNGCIPMGAVIARKSVYEAFMQGPENTIELFHGTPTRRIQQPARRDSQRSVFTSAKDC